MRAIDLDIEVESLRMVRFRVVEEVDGVSK